VVYFIYRNKAGKTIKRAYFIAGYYDVMRAFHTLPQLWTIRRRVKPGETADYSADIGYPTYAACAGRWVLSPVRAMFEDGTTWVTTDTHVGSARNSAVGKDVPSMDVVKELLSRHK
jgi:hypothetical protein